MDTSGLIHQITDLEAQVMVREAYDEDFGLDTGIFGVGMCEEEKLIAGSLWEHWAMEYKRCRIWETWHINFDDFMNRPRSNMQMLCRLGMEDEMKKLTELNQVENILKNEH